tara:strand:- start:84 stop:557 length:474 start_codon:yes stop_codon:yes gene_type:complete
MATKSLRDVFETAFQAWVQELSLKIQTDYASDAGAQLENLTTTSGSEGTTLSFTVPDSSKLDIPTAEIMQWVPATTFAGKDKSGRPTMKRRKGYQRKQKIELPKNESSMDNVKSKPSKTGSIQNVSDKIFDYHFGDDFIDFLTKRLSGKEMKAERIK